mmetsp:Transcript_88087/g.249584  ORF Transcript_88087/g.249584 Transcript_88087/m.249584 type:complete len:349 (+) Transcript_88087:710-1756(+)
MWPLLQLPPVHVVPLVCGCPMQPAAAHLASSFWKGQRPPGGEVQLVPAAPALRRVLQRLQRARRQRRARRVAQRQVHLQHAALCGAAALPHAGPARALGRLLPGGGPLRGAAAQALEQARARLLGLPAEERGGAPQLRDVPRQSPAEPRPQHPGGGDKGRQDAHGARATVPEARRGPAAEPGLHRGWRRPDHAGHGAQKRAVERPGDLSSEPGHGRGRDSGGELGAQPGGQRGWLHPATDHPAHHQLRGLAAEHADGPGPLAFVPWEGPQPRLCARPQHRGADGHRTLQQHRAGAARQRYHTLRGGRGVWEPLQPGGDGAAERVPQADIGLRVRVRAPQHMPTGHVSP